MLSPLTSKFEFQVHVMMLIIMQLRQLIPGPPRNRPPSDHQRQFWDTNDDVNVNLSLLRRPEMTVINVLSNQNRASKPLL